MSKDKVKEAEAGSDAAEGEGGEGASGKKKPPLKLLIIAGVAAVLVLGGGLSDIDEIFAALPAAISRHLFAGVEVPPLRRAEFGAASGERGAAILGARLAAG